jgi:hypothetical protein
LAFGAAAAADWATTYQALKNFHLTETNPLLQSLEARPGTLIGVGVAMDAGMVAGWNLVIGRRHPRVAAAGLWAGAIFRAYLAVRNVRNERHAFPR